jgi:hypothetical protein
MADSPSFLDGLMSGLNGAPTNPMINLGLGLMAAAKPGGNVGEALLGAQQSLMQNRAAAQQLGMNQLNMQMLKAKLPGMQAYFQGLSQLQPSQAGSSAASLGAGPTAPSAAPAPSNAFPSLTGSAPTVQGQLDPSLALNLGTFGAAYGMPGAEQLAKYPENLTQAQKALETQRRMQLEGPMALLDSAATSPNADKIIANNEQLKQHWTQTAPQLGFDPVKDLNANNAQTYARFAYNQLAGQSGVPTKEMPSQLQTAQLPDGRWAQVEPMSGKMTILPESELQQVVGPNGTPILVPKGRAAGMQPFNAQIFGASTLTDQAKEFAYQNFLQTHELPANIARNPVMSGSMLDYIAKRAQSEGNSAASILANSQQTKATQGVLKDFESGATSKTINGLNTAIQHMDALGPVADALDNGNLTLLNKAANFYKQQTGSAAPTNFAALKEFVAGEVAKAVLPGGGGDGERQALAAPINAANSPAQLKQAIEQFKTALAGKTEALRNQWDIGTNGTQGSFDRFLLPATKKALGINAQPLARPGQTDLAAAAAAELAKRTQSQ